MSAILLAMTGAGWDPAEWQARFSALAPRREVRIWPDRVGDPAEIGYVCAWKPPPGLLAQFPHLKAIFSLGAGVDHLTGDPLLPEVPLVRVVDRDLTARMTEHVVLHVLLHHRRLRLYERQQREKIWHEHAQPAASEVAVGILGLGVLGRDAAEVLARIGFRVAGFGRSEKSVPGIETFHGKAGLDAFLARTEILVCLLPHTRATEGMLNLRLLRKLKRDGALGGAYLINAGRGKLQVDVDILAALEEGTLAGASLDVFPTEPLPRESPMWGHPNVIITPHNAGVSDPRALAKNVLTQIERFERGLPLEHVVDPAAGY
jgi:glyoxylate/hydroxypyruvate reductase A